MPPHTPWSCLVGLWVEGQHGVKVELRESDQASAAMRLVD
jgi:hypothetical protein